METGFPLEVSSPASKSPISVLSWFMGNYLRGGRENSAATASPLDRDSSHISGYYWTRISNFDAAVSWLVGVSDGGRDNTFCRPGLALLILCSYCAHTDLPMTSYPACTTTSTSRVSSLTQFHTPLPLLSTPPLCIYRGLRAIQNRQSSHT